MSRNSVPGVTSVSSSLNTLPPSDCALLASRQRSVWVKHRRRPPKRSSPQASIWGCSHPDVRLLCHSLEDGPHVVPARRRWPYQIYGSHRTRIGTAGTTHIPSPRPLPSLRSRPRRKFAVGAGHNAYVWIPVFIAVGIFMCWLLLRDKVPRGGSACLMSAV